MNLFRSLSNRYDPRCFTAFRVLYGFYLTAFCAMMWPYWRVLYSSEGYLDRSVLSGKSAFLFTAWHLDTPALVQSLGAVSCLCAILIMIGSWRRTAAAALFAIFWLFQQRNVYAGSPEQPFIHWLLPLLCLVPAGEPSLFSNNKAGSVKWRMPGSLLFAAWVLLTVGYAHAAYFKFFLGDHAWREWTAMRYVLTESSPHLIWYGNFFLSLPSWIWAPVTFFVVALQLTAPMFLFSEITRRIFWAAIFAMHLGAILFLDVAWISAGMIVFQGLLWNPALAWAQRTNPQPGSA